MIKKIIKRDGRVVDFNKTKISNAIWKAVKAVGGKNKKLAEKLAEKVVKELERIFKDKIPTVEDVQDVVEKVLIEEGHAKTAKAYILYRQERRLIREEKKKILRKETIDEVDKVFDVNALKVLASRYLLKNEEGKFIESPKELFERVASHITLVDLMYDKIVFNKEGNGLKEREVEEQLKDIEEIKKNIDKYKLEIGKYNLNKWHLIGLLRVYERLLKEGKIKIGIKKLLGFIKEGKFNEYEKNIKEYYEFMVNKVFMPNSPTLMNAGSRMGQLAACFVLPIEDSLVSIMKTSSEAALICQSGGGIGINYSALRPKGDIVSSTTGIASGPVTFMEIIDTVTDVVKQGGKRRGANMGILEIWHPDIEEFINVKQKVGKLENFNLSVGLWQDFFEAIETNKDYALINPRTKKQNKVVNARKLFDLIAFSAWKSAEPGVLFLDNINKYNILMNLKGPIRATNPCGEQPLYNYESCNLGSINLRSFLKEKESGYEFDWQAYEKAIRLATRFLDNVIDINKYPLPQIEINTRKTRKIGLGVMGLADLLYELEIPYNSQAGFEFMNKLAETLSFISMDESVNLAIERGSFPLFDKSEYTEGKLPIVGYYEYNFTKDWNKLIERIKFNGIRNAFTTTIAPTGSISMIAGCSNGIEPNFALVFEKHVAIGKFYYVNDVFERKLKELGLYKDEILEKISKNYGCLLSLPEFDESLKKVFITALSMHWLDHLIAQVIWQRWVAASISKTINMPNDASVEDIKLAYLIAKELGLKGLTIYRDGSRHKQVLHIISEEKQKIFELKPSLYVLGLIKEIKSEYIRKELEEYVKRLGVDNLGVDFNNISLKKEEKEKLVKPNLELVPETKEKENGEFVTNLKIDNSNLLFSFELNNEITEGNGNECPFCKGLLIFESGCIRCMECGYSSCCIA